MGIASLLGDATTSVLGIAHRHTFQRHMISGNVRHLLGWARSSSQPACLLKFSSQLPTTLYSSIHLHQTIITNNTNIPPDRTEPPWRTASPPAGAHLRHLPRKKPPKASRSSPAHVPTLSNSCYYPSSLRLSSSARSGASSRRTAMNPITSPRRATFSTSTLSSTAGYGRRSSSDCMQLD